LETNKHVVVVHRQETLPPISVDGWDDDPTRKQFHLGPSEAVASEMRRLAHQSTCDCKTGYPTGDLFDDDKERVQHPADSIVDGDPNWCVPRACAHTATKSVSVEKPEKSRFHLPKPAWLSTHATFFIRGQVYFFHHRIASSSRWSACRCGR